MVSVNFSWGLAAFHFLKGLSGDMSALATNQAEDEVGKLAVLVASSSAIP